MRAHEVAQRMQNALADISDLVSVGAIADLAALAKAPPVARRPAAWILVESERALNDTTFTDPPAQCLTARVAVVLCTTAVHPKAAKSVEITALLDTMRHALWSIKTVDQLHFIEGAVQRVVPGELWWRDLWSASTHLIGTP